MSLKFTGSFTELQEKLSSLNGQWDSSQPNKQVLRRGDGVLNWFESTGTIQFQGKGAGKDFLEQKVPNLLYPKQFAEPTLAETIQDSPEKSGQTESLTPLQCSIERKYLESGVNDSEIVIGIVSAVGTESKRVIDPLRDRLKGFGYTVEEIRVSSILPSYKRLAKS